MAAIVIRVDAANIASSITTSRDALWTDDSEKAAEVDKFHFMAKKNIASPSKDTNANSETSS